MTLRTIAGSQAAWPEIEEELHATTPIELAEERDRLAAELDQLQTQMANDQRAIGSLEEQMRSMAHDERLGQERLHQETLRQQRVDAVRRWSVRVICRKLLDQAQQVYEKERQPQVIRQAAEYLDTMTNINFADALLIWGVYDRMHNSTESFEVVRTTKKGSIGDNVSFPIRPPDLTDRGE